MRRGGGRLVLRALRALGVVGRRPLSPVQLGLLLVVGLLVTGSLGRILDAYRASVATASVFERSRSVITALATVQRETLRLQTATLVALAEPAGDVGEARRRRDFLARQVDALLGPAATVAGGGEHSDAWRGEVDDFRRTLVAYDALLEALPTASVTERPEVARQLRAGLDRLEVQATALYDGQERRSFGSVGDYLRAEQASLLLLMGMRGLVVVLGVALLLSLRRSVDEEFGRAYTLLEAEMAERQQAEVAVQEVNRRLRGALAELATAQEQVVQQERLRALGEMASGIAHDINNTLSPVVGFSELLLTNPGFLADEAAARRYLGLIHTAGRDAAATMRRLSEFYRPRAAGEGVEPVDVHRLVEDVMALTQPRWKDQAQGAGRPVRMTADLAPVPPVAGRAEELREALTNLVFNAVDALPQGGAVTLRARPDPAASGGPGTPGARVLLEVQDDGVGMSEEVRQRCVEPFFSTKRERGTGLGLAMVYGVVRRHSGELEVDSAPGRGTTVRLTLPAYASAAGAPAALATVPVGRLRVLVVDDEPLVREATAAYLTADGHLVRTAPGGREAVGALGTEPFDLVVTDRAMPDLAGEAVARAAAALGTPVILLTGFGDLMTAMGEHVPGVTRVLAKPVTAATLREAVAAAMSGTAAPRAAAPPELPPPR